VDFPLHMKKKGGELVCVILCEEERYEARLGSEDTLDVTYLPVRPQIPIFWPGEILIEMFLSAVVSELDEFISYV